MESFRFNRCTPLRSLLPIPLLLCLLLLTESPQAVSAERIVVGGKQKWTSGVNYTAWAESRRFHVGDWLVFYWEKGMYDVLEVNATNYQKCSGEDPRWNWSRGDRAAYNLNESRQYYFICSTGYCWQGMKMEFFAEPLPHQKPRSSLLAQAPSSAGSWAAVDLLRCVLLTALIFVLCLF